MHVALGAIQPSPELLSGVIHTMAEQDLGNALAHLATMEGDFSPSTYNDLYKRNRQLIDRLLGLCREGEFFAQASLGRVSATDMQEPAIYDLAMHPKHEHLLIGAFTTEISQKGEAVTHRRGLSLSATQFTHAITSREVAVEALGMLESDPAASALFAGNEAVAVLDSLVGASVIDIMQSRQLPIPPRVA